MNALYPQTAVISKVQNWLCRLYGGSLHLGLLNNFVAYEDSAQIWHSQLHMWRHMDMDIDAIDNHEVLKIPL